MPNIAAIISNSLNDYIFSYTSKKYFVLRMCQLKISKLFFLNYGPTTCFSPHFFVPSVFNFSRVTTTAWTS